MRTYDDVIIDVKKHLTEIRLLAALHLNDAKFKSKGRYDRDAKKVYYREGQLVYILDEPKIGKHNGKFLGPYEIESVHDKNTVEIISENENTKIILIDKS